MSIVLTPTQRSNLLKSIDKGYKATKLQIFKYGEEILDAIKEPCSVFQAPTGLGKSTQLPKIISLMLKETGGLSNSNKKIIVTQPRRLAARELAKFTNSAYWVRNDRSENYNTKNIVYMTEGILINLLNSEKPPEIEYLIIDEAHELKGETIIVLAQAMKTLKCPVMICSATIDPDYFTRYMRRASVYMQQFRINRIPVINLLENRFPVAVTYSKEYIPKDVHKTTEGILDLFHKDKLNYLDECIIIFLPGLDYIDDLYCGLEKMFIRSPDRIIHCLYGGMPSEEQDAVMKAKLGEVILATNVAETSITIPDATMCIDSGWRKSAIYNTDSNISMLECSRITQSMAQQRKGRVGRLKPGKCFRMYTEEEFNKMDQYPRNELESSDLRPILLRILGFGVRIDKLDMICSLSESNYRNAYNYLSSIESVEIMSEYGDTLKQLSISDSLADSKIYITDIGREIAKFPIDIGLARFMISSNSSEIKNISEYACMLTGIIGNIHTWFFKIRRTEDEKRAKFKEICFDNEHEMVDGDLPMMMNIFHDYWKYVNEKRPKYPERRDWCRARMCNMQNLEAAREEAIQYIQLLGKDRLDLPEKAPDEEEWICLRDFLMNAFPNNVAMRNQESKRKMYGDSLIPFPRSIVSFSTAPSLVLYMVSFKVKGLNKKTGIEEITHYIDGMIEVDPRTYLEAHPEARINPQAPIFCPPESDRFLSSSPFRSSSELARSSEDEMNDFDIAILSKFIANVYMNDPNLGNKIVRKLIVES